MTRAGTDTKRGGMDKLGSAAVFLHVEATKRGVPILIGLKKSPQSLAIEAELEPCPWYSLPGSTCSPGVDVQVYMLIEYGRYVMVLLNKLYSHDLQIHSHRILSYQLSPRCHCTASLHCDEMFLSCIATRSLLTLRGNTQSCQACMDTQAPATS